MFATLPANNFERQRQNAVDNAAGLGRIAIAAPTSTFDECLGNS
jgi:hypothetical protein